MSNIKVYPLIRGQNLVADLIHKLWFTRSPSRHGFWHSILCSCEGITTENVNSSYRIYNTDICPTAYDSSYKLRSYLKQSLSCQNKLLFRNISVLRNQIIRLRIIHSTRVPTHESHVCCSSISYYRGFDCTTTGTWGHKANHSYIHVRSKRAELL